MYVIRGRLTPEASALLMRAIEAAGDALYREDHVPGVPESEGAVARRQADAMGLLTERATAAGFAASEGQTDSTPISGSRAKRYQVVLHVDPETLAAEGEPGRSELEDGTRDRGCRFPGCGLRFADANHVVHWADGGATSLTNTVLLCRHHHRLVHEGGWTVQWWGRGGRCSSIRAQGRTSTGAGRRRSCRPSRSPR